MGACEGKGRVNPGTVDIVLRTNDFVKNKYDSMTLNATRAGEVCFIKADPGAFGAFTLIKLDESAGLGEISKTYDYRQKRAEGLEGD